MLKKIIFSALIAFSMATQATELQTFPDVVSALGKGSQMVFVVTFKDCTGTFPFLDVQISVKPNALMLVEDQYLTASDQHFTLNNPKHSGEPVIDYGKYTIYADGRVEIDMTVLDAKNYQELKKYSSHCVLGKSFQVFDSKHSHREPELAA